MIRESNQLVSVAKRFRWESAHRLPRHEGACRHLHGHSYAMTVELEGLVGETGMVVDFQEIKALIKPLVDEWDHATLIAEYDRDLLEAVQRLDSRYVVLPFDTTAENLAIFAADHLERTGRELLERHGIARFRIRVEETETSFVEVARAIGS